MRIVCLSDTHGLHDRIDVPDGDLLLHAGDATGRGTLPQIDSFNRWLGTLPHRHKVVIAGNHDWGFQLEPTSARALITHATYLEDSGCEIEGLKIWGSPWQPEFFDWAFNLPRGDALKRRWDLIPDGTDILVTHGPPHGILDVTDRGDHAGCEALIDAVRRIRPKVHLFGHIHEAYGLERFDGITYINACNCDLRYRPVQPAIVIDL